MEFVEYIIGDIARSIRTGTTPSKTNKNFFDGDFLWLTPSDFKGQMILKDSEFTISKLAIESKKAFLFNKDTVLITTIGDIGKVTINNFPVASNQQITGVELKPGVVLPELFYYWVKLNKGLLQFKANKAIISILTNKHLKKIRITVPKSLTDQQKIVSELNQLQNIIDLKVKTLETIEKLKKSFFLEYFLENPLSKEWEYLSVENTKAVKKTQYGLTEKPDSDTGEYPVLRMNNLTYNGDIDLSNLKYVIITKDKFESNQIQDREVLFNRTNSPDLVGKLAVWDKGIGYTYAGYLFRILLDDDILNPYYFSGYFNSLFGKYVLRNKARISGNLANISASNLLKQKILLAPLDMQKKYEDVYKTLNLIRERLELSLNIFQQLFDSHLQKSFLFENISEREDEIRVEYEVFDDLINTFNIEQIKENNRLSILIDWVENNKFSDIDKYDVAFKHMLSLLEDGIIEQKSIRGKIKLTVSE